MYRKLLATTALSLVMAGGALAQDVMEPAPMDPMSEPPAVVEQPADPLITAAERGISANGWLASEIMGETIYNSAADDAESIGEVNDFVLDQDGSIGAIVVGVGGFLGIGQKDVAVDWSDLQLVMGADGNQRIVASVTREQLDAAAEFDRAEWLASEAASGAVIVDDVAPVDPMASAVPMEPAVPAEPAPADATDWTTFQPVMINEVSADELTGTTVYGAGDENIGSIGDIILSEGGEVDAVIIDFGGFLGIGTKPVAVGFDNLTFLRDTNGGLVLRTSLSREQLDAAPEYNEEAYMAAPGETVVIVD